jgi:hypothetical protein
VECCLGVVVDGVAVDQRATDVVEEAIQQLRFEGIELWLDDVVPVLVSLMVAVDRDERERGVEPVTVDLFVAL